MTTDTPKEPEEIEDLKSEKTKGSDDDSGDGESEATEALDELEAEELEMLTEDESNEAIVVDEAAEMRAIRRAEIAMETPEVDEAAVTGEPYPVKRDSGGNVTSGTMNLTTAVVVEVTGAGADSFVARMAMLVEGAIM